MPKIIPGLRAAMRTYHHQRAHRQAVRALSAMEDAMLNDIGLSRSDICAAVDGRVRYNRSE